jgi:hypothetical protein
MHPAAPSLKTIAVNCGCQSFGIAAALGALLPSAVVAPQPLPTQWSDAAQERACALQLSHLDAWVTTSHTDLLDRHLGCEPAQRPRVITVPSIHFAAFHPDICYATRSSTAELTEHHYNSAIAVWAYRHGVPAEAAQHLFNDRVFRGLGYYRGWNAQVRALQQAFAESQLHAHFDAFFLRVQRTGSFMHSCNHPRIHVLVRLAQIIAQELGCAPAVLEQHIEVDDFLSQDSWPLYPEVARSLSIPGGSYRWRFKTHTLLDGVRAYLDFAYSAYQGQGIAPDDIAVFAWAGDRYDRSDALYDRVLGAELARAA